jgi:predicted GNAT family N-acyltransferase
MVHMATEIDSPRSFQHLVTTKTGWVQFVTPEEIRPLRHRLLLSWHPFERTIYPRDEAETTAHVGAFVRDEQGEAVLVGISSVYREDPDAHSLTKAWRIRGVATEEWVRGQGWGRWMMEAICLYVASQSGDWVWCNARTPAVSFYENIEFERMGEEYQIEGIGPHYFVARSIP